MFSIQEYLKKFKALGESVQATDSAIRKAFTDAGLAEGSFSFSIRGSVIVLTADPVAKNIVFFSKEKILSSIAAAGLSKKFTDIR
jgi:hypothetical protein